MYEVSKELQHKKASSAKVQVKELSSSKGIATVKVYSYEGSSSKGTLTEKGNFQMNIFSYDQAGIALFRKSILEDLFCKDVMTSVNSEKIRLAQNANRTWDKVSESAQLKTASLTIAKELLSGKFGKELQEKAKTEFPKDKFPSLYI